MKAALLLLALAPAAFADDFPLPPPPPGPHVEYSADQADFDAEHSMLHLSGGVVMKESSITVKGQDLWIDTSDRRGRSDAPLLVEDGFSAVYGDSGEFDFDEHTARVFRTSAGSGDWRIHAREGGLRGDRSARYVGADFTSCAVVPPHYHFHASRVYVKPKKYLLSTNTLFYLGPVPVFYTPVFFKSLESEPHLRWQFRPGYDNRDGAYVKGTLTTRYSTSTYSKIFDDYYQKMGFGYGAELEHHAGEDSRGGVYGYAIHEDGTTRDRRGLFGSAYQKLVSSTSFQGRLQLQSDPTFTNDYVRSDLFRLTPELVNSAALTRVTEAGTARLLYARDDVQSSTAPARFARNTESAPRLEGQTAPFRVGRLPWLNTVSGFADDNYALARGYQQKSVNGTWSGTRSFVLARGLSYTPTAAYSQTYYDRFDETAYLAPVPDRNKDSTVGRWTVSNGLRARTAVGNLDATHAYTQRLQPGGFTADAAQTDKSVEQNLLTLSDVFVPARRTWARLSTGYTFATFRDRELGFAERVQPVAVDLNWQATRKLAFAAHDQYKPGLGRGMHQSVILDARWGDPGRGFSAGGGLAYNLSSPGTYYQSLDLGFGPDVSTPTWRVSIGLRSLVSSAGGVQGAHGARLFEKEITWTRRWHDFRTKLVARSRPGGVGEVTGAVELRFGEKDRKTPERRDWESEWFPDRARDSSDLRP